ncbi:ribonuclease P protein component [Streptococcus zalophi]|uniref:Ribonuclease P protein component n=1 Tax=Streptococcus zalophi TaxID=640031 RepID=A0A934UDH4_9STRE|nr:ribonuclease P protein component [Streptococcus zalophi]MBJ8349802.1 ribonuclease P protein component [Streptococcus zalophi]MCR8967571.1 ribonuclease P protein component [Streptococcus zalophi]
MKKTHRVKSDKDFKAIFDYGKSAANRHFVLYYLDKNYPHYRVGLSVSKKLGNAVVRNNIKRKIRHAFMELSQDIDHKDYVIIARKGVENLDYQAIKKNMIHVFSIAKCYSKKG